MIIVAVVFIEPFFHMVYRVLTFSELVVGCSGFILVKVECELLCTLSLSIYSFS